MTSLSLPRPAADEFNPFYAGYVAKVPDGDVVKFLETQLREVRSLLSTIPEGRGGHAYAPGKWTIKEVIGHMCDAERIFAYRALRIARKDATPLAGFEQNDYVPAGQFGKRTMASLVDEVVQVRDATLSLVRTFDAEAGARRGTASGKEVSVRALVYIIAGHMAHHVTVLREQYGVGAK
ncbi:MAG TPA: DinB family protein [Gemmatimonadales bacterium]|nr:DinB family protein [Gemmatimonadales bacterium]